jgi:hypothetical protein
MGVICEGRQREIDRREAEVRQQGDTGGNRKVTE